MTLLNTAACLNFIIKSGSLISVMWTMSESGCMAGWYYSDDMELLATFRVYILNCDWQTSLSVLGKPASHDSVKIHVCLLRAQHAALRLWNLVDTPTPGKKPQYVPFSLPTIHLLCNLAWPWTKYHHFGENWCFRYILLRKQLTQVFATNNSILSRQPFAWNSVSGKKNKHFHFRFFKVSFSDSHYHFD